MAFMNHARWLGLVVLALAWQRAAPAFAQPDAKAGRSFVELPFEGDPEATLRQNLQRVHGLQATQEEIDELIRRLQKFQGGQGGLPNLDAQRDPAKLKQWV